MISWKNSLWSRWFSTSNWDRSWYSRLTYYLPFRVACIVLGILNPFDRKKYIPNNLSIYIFFNLWQTWNSDSETAFQIILAIGTELQSILTKMALEISERHAVVQGIPLVQGSDQYFWFGRPQLVLHLIHFALFQVLNCLFFLLISDLRYLLKD